MGSSIEEINGDLVGHFSSAVTDPPRVIGTYEGQSVDLHHIREDIRAGYTDEEIAEVFKQIEIEGMGYENFQHLFHTGQMGCTIYAFELAMIYHIPHDPFSGLVVSVECEADVDQEALIRLGKAAMGET